MSELSAGTMISTAIANWLMLLCTALKNELEKRGVLSEVRAKLRSEVYKSLSEEIDQVSVISKLLVSQTEQCQIYDLGRCMVKLFRRK